MENKSIKVINLSNNPIYSFGEYISTGSKWIEYGKNNDYPEYLRELYLNSPTNQAIIDGVTNLATGEGVEVLNPEQNPISNKWLNENFDKSTVKKLISDLKMYGYCTVQVYNGSIVKYTEAVKYRFDVDKKDFIWFSKDWEHYTYQKNRPVKLPVYKEGTDAELSIMFIQIDTKSFDYYSPVDYNGSINYIELEAQISEYHLANIKNGLFPSFVINFIGTDYSDEQMEQIERDINKKFGGASNTGRAIVGFSATKDDATTLETVDQPSLPDTYQFLTTECSQKILLGHGVTSPLLFGITRDSGNGLGSNAEELSQSFYLFYESKLKHYQEYILELITKIMNGNLLYGEVEFITYNPFNITENDEELHLSVVKPMNEIESQVILKHIDELKVKTDDILIDEKLVSLTTEGKLYKFVKSGTNNNIIGKKFEILSNKGYVFEADDLIKNTKDYYFVELTYMKKNK